MRHAPCSLRGEGPKGPTPAFSCGDPMYLARLLDEGEIHVAAVLTWLSEQATAAPELLHAQTPHLQRLSAIQLSCVWLIWQRLYCQLVH